MRKAVIKWVRESTGKLVNSIAFYPALISLGFLLLSILMLEFDFSETGKHLKAQLSWISLRDASTARTILATITGGIISLAVFSFSMVMILLNQAASQMSNRMLDSMIGNKFQQIILGFYIGTIVYSLFLLSTIRDISSGIYVPALSIYLLLLFTVVDIFLFIYFLHYVTQSVKFETIIERIHRQTCDTLNQTCLKERQEIFVIEEQNKQLINMPSSNYYQGFDEHALIAFAQKHQLILQFIFPAGSYILKGCPFICLYGPKVLNRDEIDEILLTTDLYSGQPISRNAYYGYHQLAEVAIKALSPGINDPETAVLSLHALTDLFRFRLVHHFPHVLKDNDDRVRIILATRSFEHLFSECYYSIWDYGKDDRFIQKAMNEMISQLMECTYEENHQLFLRRFKRQIESKATGNN